MSDATIFLNETTGAERSFDLTLLNPAGTARVTSAAGAAIIKIGAPGGTTLSVDSGCALTEMTGGSDHGPYRFEASAAAVSALGEVAYEISTGGTPATAGCAPAWAPSTFYATDTRTTNGANVYLCTTGGMSAGSGGPTGTGSGITDNAAVWSYLGAAFATVQGSFKVTNYAELIAAIQSGLELASDPRLAYLNASISSIIAAAGVIPVTSPAPQSYGLVTGDLSPAMPIDVVGNGGAVDLSTSTAQVLRWLRPDGSLVTAALTAVSPVAGQLERVWSAGDTALIGTHYGQVVITNADSTTTTYPQDGSYYVWNVYPQLAVGETNP